MVVEEEVGRLQAAHGHRLVATSRRVDLAILEPFLKY
jgi:hypothetical protein